MIFLANIGNTNLSYGLYDGEIIATERYPIKDLIEQQDITKLCCFLLKKYRLSAAQIQGAVLSSVVPEKTPVLLEALKNSFSPEPLLISDSTPWQLDRSAYSGLLGTDRLLCCQAALKKYKPPFVVIDCGTATTLNVINQDGSFPGGIILPGVLTALQALTAKTSLLPYVSMLQPNSIIGHNTTECIQSGATYGTAALLEGLTIRIQQELKSEVSVIITGGNSEAIIPYCNITLHHEPNLLLEGLAIKFMEQDTNFNMRRPFFEYK